MSGNDLFSFLNDEDNDDEQNVVESEDVAPPNPSSSTSPSAMDVDGATSTSPSSKKRKVDAFPPTNGTTSGANETQEVAMDEREDAGPSLLKKPRIAEPSPAPLVQPVVVDEFETEAKREVAASAGLTGAAEAAGSRLELKHQVSVQCLGPVYFPCWGPGALLSGWILEITVVNGIIPCCPVVVLARVLVSSEPDVKF